MIAEENRSAAPVLRAQRQQRKRRRGRWERDRSRVARTGCLVCTTVAAKRPRKRRTAYRLFGHLILRDPLRVRKQRYARFVQPSMPPEHPRDTSSISGQSITPCPTSHGSTDHLSVPASCTVVRMLTTAGSDHSQRPHTQRVDVLLSQYEQNPAVLTYTGLNVPILTPEAQIHAQETENTKWWLQIPAREHRRLCM